MGFSLESSGAICLENFRFVAPMAATVWSLWVASGAICPEKIRFATVAPMGSGATCTENFRFAVPMAPMAPMAVLWPL